MRCNSRSVYSRQKMCIRDRLTGLYGLEVVGNASVKIVLEELLDRKEAVNDEYYTCLLYTASGMVHH